MDSTVSGTSVKKRPNFWTRQFGPKRTGAQDVFDAIFGLVLPIVCFIADPIVFKSFPILGPALLEDYQLFAYVVSTVEMGFFLVWRTFPGRVNHLSPLFAGVFFIGACFSTVIGVMMLPVTVWTLLIMIGLLGFVPFLSAFVYLRNGVRAINAQATPSFASRFTVAALGGVVVFGSLVFASVVAENSISAAVDSLIYGNVAEAQVAQDRLKWFRFVPLKQCNRLALAYGREWNPDKKEVLRRAYREITGDDVELQQRMLAD